MLLSLFTFVLIASLLFAFLGYFAPVFFPISRLRGVHAPSYLITGDPSYRFGLRSHTYIEPALIPSHLILSLLYTEDTKFFDHRGFNWPEIRCRLLASFKSGMILGSGSSLTQQMARLVFLTSSKNPLRKIVEAILTVRLERNFSKKELLGLYISVAHLGNELWGFNYASLLYFDKPIQELSAAESTTLCILIRKPRHLAKKILNGDDDFLWETLRGTLFYVLMFYGRHFGSDAIFSTPNIPYDELEPLIKKKGLPTKDIDTDSELAKLASKRSIELCELLRTRFLLRSYGREDLSRAIAF